MVVEMGKFLARVPFLFPSNTFFLLRLFTHFLSSLALSPPPWHLLPSRASALARLRPRAPSPSLSRLRPLAPLFPLASCSLNSPPSSSVAASLSSRRLHLRLNPQPPSPSLSAPFTRPPLSSLRLRLPLHSRPPLSSLGRRRLYYSLTPPPLTSGK